MKGILNLAARSGCQLGTAEACSWKRAVHQLIFASLCIPATFMGKNMTPAKRFACWSIFLFARFISSGSANEQAIADTVAPLLEKPLHPTAATAFHLHPLFSSHIANRGCPATPAH